nr:putative reverse transcriptase domain-containing protein [Tanacetum cinerariifolium]
MNCYNSSIRCAPFEALYGRRCRSLFLWAEIGEIRLIGPELVQETTDKVVLIKEKLKAARDRQKRYADNMRKPLEFEVGDRVLLKVSPWKGVICFGKKKCLADANLHVPLDEIKVDKTLRFVEEPVETMDREAKSLKCSKIPIVKDGISLRRGYCDNRDLSREWQFLQTSTSNTTNADGTSTSTISGLVTTEEKAKKNNDVKPRSMLLMALLNEHLLTFSQYNDAKTLLEAKQVRFCSNDAIKKTQRTLLKQMYENFNAPSIESLNSIFNMLQKIVSQLAILGENISQEDLNMKFLRSFPAEWNTHVVVWRNKVDLDTMSFDDLYNNFKIVKQEVKRTIVSISTLGSPNMAFLSSTGSTNEVDTAIMQVSVVSTPVTNQPNGSQLVHEDLEQTHEDDLEEMDLKWQLTLLSMRARRYFLKTGKKITINGSDTAGYDKTKVECFNCHKLGYFAMEYRSLRNQESRPKNQDNSRKTVIVEDTSSKAMVEIDGAEKLKKEKESNQIKIDNFENASKSLDKLIGSQITDNSKTGLAFTIYNVFAPPSTGLFAPPTVDLSNFGLKEFKQPEFEGYGPKASKGVSVDTLNEIKKALNALIIEDWVSDSDEDGSEEMVLKYDNVQPEQAKQPRKGNKVRSVVGNQWINAVKSLACWVWRPKLKSNIMSPKIVDHTFVNNLTMLIQKADSRNISYLTNFKEHDGGYIAFGGGAKGESSRTESKEQDTSSRSGNDAHDDVVDIRPIYDEEPMAEVQTTAEINVFAIGQQHTEQREFNNEGEVVHNAEECHDTCPLPAIENESLKKNYKELFDSIKITRAKTTEHTSSLIATNDKFRAQLKEKGFAIAALRNELRKSTGNSVNTKFAKSSILGKPMSQPLRNQSVVRHLMHYKYYVAKYNILS